MNTTYLCSVREAAQALGVGRTKIYELLGDSKLDSLRIGSRRLIKVASIEALVHEANGGLS